jgi:hypothetical protein
MENKTCEATLRATPAFRAHQKRSALPRMKEAETARLTRTARNQVIPRAGESQPISSLHLRKARENRREAIAYMIPRRKMIGQTVERLLPTALIYRDVKGGHRERNRCRHREEPFPEQPGRPEEREEDNPGQHQVSPVVEVVVRGPGVFVGRQIIMEGGFKHGRCHRGDNTRPKNPLRHAPSTD